MQKASSHRLHSTPVAGSPQSSQSIRTEAEWSRLLHIVCNRFQVYFTPLEGVLFTFPSRYLFTIGCQGVFSLIPWSGQIHAEFHVHRITWDTPRGPQAFAHPAVTVYGWIFHSITLTFHRPRRGPATPERQVLPVWALPLSLATTYGITFVFYSWGY